MFDPDVDKAIKLRASKPTKTQNAMDQRVAEKLTHTKAAHLPEAPRPPGPVRIADQEEVFKFYFKSSLAIRLLYGYQVKDGKLVLTNPDRLANVAETRKASLRQAVLEWDQEAKKAL